MYFLRIWLIFLYFYNTTVPCIVKFTGHLLSDEILLAVRECKREGMGITDGKEKGMGIKQATTGIEDGNGNEPWGMGGNGIDEDIPAHIHTVIDFNILNSESTCWCLKCIEIKTL